MTGARAVVVVAHPDDETVAFGSRLASFSPQAVMVLTDGAPRDPWFARQAGCASRGDYARLRRSELHRALALGGVGIERLYLFDVPDQEAVRELDRLTRAVAAVLRRTRATRVATHAYEGGHPDHDAAAWVVHAAVAALGGAIEIVEAPLYHDAFGETAYHHFIPFRGAGPPEELRLEGDALARKQAMVRAYASQAEVLARFDPAREPLRRAPRYDFAAPPHSGRLHYERWGWPVTGASFRAAITVANGYRDPSRAPGSSDSRRSA
ncbi:MAG TPA: PIG-L family deacetylase [Polyangia bacterium]